MNDICDICFFNINTAYLQELFGRSNISLRDWLDWNEKEKKFKNSDRFDEFLSWLYPKLNDQGELDPDLPGNWEKRRIPRTQIF